MTTLASFDVFDTLVCRLVAEPVDVFKIMEAELGDLVPKGFASLRVRAETLARRESKKEDVTLEEIYLALGRIATIKPLDLIDLMEAEVATEIRLCVPRRDVQATLLGYVDKGIRCIAISDMYLPHAAVEAILSKCGIGVDRVYVSSETMATKARGTMFDFVRKAEGVEFTEWTHHGDNYHSDVVSAVTKGISALHTPIGDFTLTSTDNQKSDLVSSIVTGTVRSLMYGKSGADIARKTWFQVGADYTGILSLLLCWKAREKAISVGSPTINFLARDGYILKAVYDAIYEEPERETVYLAASRRMINFIQTTAEDMNLKFLTANSEGLTGRELLARIGVEGPDSDHDLSWSIKNQDEASAIVQNYKREILDRAWQERLHVIDYLTDKGIISDRPTVVVDVGWFCSIQKTLTAISRSQGRSGTLHGVYFGTNVPRDRDFDAEGLFYTDGRPTARAAGIKRHIEVMELLFTAPEQSIVTVERSGEGFDVVRVGTDDEKTRIDAASCIAEGAVAFTRAVMEADLLGHFTREEAIASALSRFENLVHHPARNISTAIRAIKHSVGFGGSRYEPFVRDCGSIRNPIRFMRTYLKSYWPEALSSDFSPLQKLLTSRPFVLALYIQWHLRQLLPAPLRTAAKRLIRL